MGSLGQDFQTTTTPKRLIVCCDGTWQSSVSGLKNVPSNVTRLARSFARTGRDPNGTTWQQIVHYDAGIGTGASTQEDRDRQGGFGIGFVGNVIEAYNFIVLNYAPGDQIFCFGFSRGAYTARAVAGLVNDIGIISPRDLQDFPDLYALYQKNDDSNGFRKSQAYREWCHGALNIADSPVDVRGRPTAAQMPQYGRATHTDAPESTRVVQVVGVFDTVGSLGIPDLSWTKLNKQWLNSWFDIPSPGFHNVALSPYIRHAFHALALDEHRTPFSPTLWHYANSEVLATKKPTRSHHEIHQNWRNVRADPYSTPEQITASWNELIDCEMYDELEGTGSELLQVWFPGVHINIGGGSDDPLTTREGDFEQIALISFAWMCEQISPYVQLDENLSHLAINSVQDRYQLFGTPPQAPKHTQEAHGSHIGWMKKASSMLGLEDDGPKPIPPEVQYGWAEGPIVDSYTGAVRLAGSTKRTPGQYGKDKSHGVKLGKTNEMIHPSVYYRSQQRSDYKPEALDGFSRRQTAANGFEWTNGSATIPEYLIKPEDVFTRYIVDQAKLKEKNQAAEFVQGIDHAVGLKAQ